MTPTRPTCPTCGAPGRRDEFGRAECDCQCGKILTCSWCDGEWEYRYPDDDSAPSPLCDFCLAVAWSIAYTDPPRTALLRDFMLAFRREWKEWKPAPGEVCAFDDTVEALERLFAAYMGPVYEVDLESGMATRKKEPKR